MLAESPDALQRRDYHALRTLCGTAPVTRRSGKSCIVTRRHACNRRLRNAAFNWGNIAVRHDSISKAKYQALRARGHGHARALRSVVDRLLYVACTMLERELCSTLHLRRRRTQLRDTRSQLHHLLAQRRMIGSSEGRGRQGPVKADSRRRRGAMASPSRGLLRPAHTPLPDIDDLFA